MVSNTVSVTHDTDLSLSFRLFCGCRCISIHSDVITSLRLFDRCLSRVFSRSIDRLMSEKGEEISVRDRNE